MGAGQQRQSGARPMLWAIGDPALESALLTQAHNAGIDVRRRCVDAVELVAACSVSPGAPVLVHMDLPRLSREVLGAIMDHTRELTIITSTDHQHSLATSWGLGRVIRVNDSPSMSAVDKNLFDNVLPALRGESISWPNDECDNKATGAHIVCTWSAHGSTGKSTLALGLSEAWARNGERVLLIDADTRAPSLATSLGITDDVSGLVVACRYADQNSLDQRSLTSACRELKENLWILTGLSDPQRWPEVGAASLGSVIGRAREFFDRVVIDIAPAVFDAADLPDGHMADPLARLRPARNAASLAALRSADTVLVVIRPDAVGALRLVHDFDAGRKHFAQAEPVFVVNRVQPKYHASLQREFSGICAGLMASSDRKSSSSQNDVPMLVMIPEDRVAPAMVRESATMAEVKSTSKIFQSMRKMAGELTVVLPIEQAPQRLRRRKNHHKIADFGPLIKLLSIFSRHPNATASGNR